MAKKFINIKRVIRQLIARGGRTFLTMLGIIIGVAGVIIIISLGAGAQNLVVGQVSKLGSNLIGVLPGKSNETGPPAQVFGVQIETLNDRDLDAMKDKSRAPFVSDVAGFVRGSATVIGGVSSVDTNFTATDGSYIRVQNAEMLLGQFFTDIEADSGANVAVLGYDVYTELFPSENPIGKIIKVTVKKNGTFSSVPFRVVGVQKKLGNVFFQNQDDQIFIPRIIGERQLLGINHIQFIRAKVDTPAHVKASILDIQTILREEHNIKNPPDGDDFSVRDTADAIKILTSITNGLRVFLGIMAGISLLVGGIGIMNIMLVTVSERTREIGLRKAIGATKNDIRDQFLLEASLLTFGGGLIGIFVGVLFSYLIALGARFAGYDWAFVISGWAILISVGVSVMVGIIFGLYPAKKASKLDPIIALRYE